MFLFALLHDFQVGFREGPNPVAIAANFELLPSHQLALHLKVIHTPIILKGQFRALFTKEMTRNEDRKES